MHYVQDFVELIEGLPEEIVGKLKKIKELDQDVQNSLRNIRKKENAYFTEASGKPDDTRTVESKKISKDYEEVAKIANVKVKVATELENLISRYHKKLDQDLEKFKKELESETPGITEKLERKKHTESDLAVIDDLAGKFLESNSPAGIERREQSRFETVPNLFEVTFPYEHDKPLSSLELMDHDGLLSAPQHMEEISIEPRPGQTIEWLPPRIDPNEPTYCTCNQVSYGEMVGCDNQKCPIEWFHYGCVGIKEPPNGNWFCPLCRSMQKKQESDSAD